MPVLIPVAKLKKQCNPFKDLVWGCDLIYRNDIKIAIKEKNFVSTHNFNDNEWDENIGRVAWFVVNGWNDAIEIDVGIPSMQCHVNWMVTDGNHRLAAAIYRKDRHILASVGGSLEYAMELFGVDCQEPKAPLFAKLNNADRRPADQEGENPCSVFRLAIQHDLPVLKTAILLEPCTP